LDVCGSTLPSTVASTTPVTDLGVLNNRSHFDDVLIGKTGGRVDILIGQDLIILPYHLNPEIGLLLMLR
jgi:hypothetical protein